VPQISFRIAVVPADGVGDGTRISARVSGAPRTWFHRGRAEPFAAALSWRTPAESASASDELGAEVLGAMEDEFRAANRASVTSSLTRALLAGHATLAAANALTLPEQRATASVVVAAARESGVYVARTGATIIGAVSATDTWARSGDPLGNRPAEATTAIGGEATPHGTSELVHLHPGDVALLLPGITIADVPDDLLARALRGARDLNLIAQLLAMAPAATSGLVIWHAPPEEALDDPRWTLWASDRSSGALPQLRSAAPPRAAPIPSMPSSARPPTPDVPEASVRPPASPRPPRPQPPVNYPPARPPGRMEAEARPEPWSPVPLESRTPAVSDMPPAAVVPPRPPRRRSTAGHGEPLASRARASLAMAPAADAIQRLARQARTGRWARLLPLAPLVLLLLVALFLLRGVLPLPGGPAQAIADASRIMQQADNEPDPATAAGLYDRAIAILTPQDQHNEGVQTLLADAQGRRDRVLNIVRVPASNIQQFTLAVAADSQPAGIWRNEDGLFVLDLGTQSLYRTDDTGTQLETALQPGEDVMGQPLGKIVTAAWSPPRGSNTEGMLLLVDSLRTMISVGPRGTQVQRWTPPDSMNWRRIGAAAATFDRFYVLDLPLAGDTGGGQILSYPTRQPGEIGTVAATSSADVDLSSAIDLATDGNLFVLFPDGRIVKLAPGGGTLAFDGSVPDGPLSAPVAIFASEDLDHLWVLEPSQSRIVEMTTDGAYARQYVLPPELIRNAVELHVDGTAREIRVLTPQAILLVEMDQ